MTTRGNLSREELLEMSGLVEPNRDIRGSILEELGKHGPTSIDDLARNAGLSNTQMRNTLKRMRLDGDVHCGSKPGSQKHIYFRADGVGVIDDGKEK